MDTSFLLLAGGENKRIKDISLHKPKCLLEFNGVPFLISVIKKLIQYSKNIFVGINRNGEEYIKASLLKYGFQNKVKLIIEDVNLGTGGSIRLMEEHVNTHYYIVLNTDTVLKFNFYKLTEFHESHNFPITQLLSIYSAQNEGAIGFREKDNLIVSNFESLAKEDWIKESNIDYYSSTGCYIINNKTISNSYELKNLSLEKGIIPNFTKINAVKGYVNPSEYFFFDFGVPERYLWLLENSDIIEKIYG